MITTLADPTTIALAQLPVSKAAVDENLQMHRTYIERAAALGAHVVAFPELSHEIARKFLKELRKKAAASDDGSVYGERDRALQDIEFLLSNPSTDGACCRQQLTFKNYRCRIVGVTSLTSWHLN